MKTGYTKQVQVVMTFDHEGNIIDGTNEGEKDSRFLGITFFTPEGERSVEEGKSPVILVPYLKMTDTEKTQFDTLVANFKASENK